MLKARSIALAALILVDGLPVAAGWRSPIIGAKAILPSTFSPQGWIVVGPPPGLVPARLAPGPEAAIRWSLPLVDRKPTAAEKAADIAPELQDAILRIEPMYDPTRIEGPDAPPAMAVSAGSAAMNNVFADRWRRASLDPTVDAKVTPLAAVWMATDSQSCDAFTKRRPHGFGEPALTALGDEDCAALRVQEAQADDAVPGPIVAGLIDVPVFAAPLPGSRLSSEDFWAARKARIAAIQAHLQRKWRTDAARPTEVGSR